MWSKPGQRPMQTEGYYRSNEENGPTPTARLSHWPSIRRGRRLSINSITAFPRLSNANAVLMATWTQLSRQKGVMVFSRFPLSELCCFPLNAHGIPHEITETTQKTNTHSLL